MAAATTTKSSSSSRNNNSRTRRRRNGLGLLLATITACALFTTSLVVWKTTSTLFLHVEHQQQQEQQLRLHSSSTSHLSSQQSAQTEAMESLRIRLPQTIWSQAGDSANPHVAQLVKEQLTSQEMNKACELCGKFLYSNIRSGAVKVHDEQTFVATGDIDDMWTCDSAVQIGLYVSRLAKTPFLRPVVEGAIRRQAFNTIQDPYANAYEETWVDASKLPLKDLVIGRGGFVATRNYELDSGAYFLTQLYDYYVAPDMYRPEVLLGEPLIYNAVMLMIDVWIVEQHHDDQSPYRYFELPNNGTGSPTSYTGMTWTGFRPSDDPCQYGYLVPANIFAAGALERTLALNDRIWKSDRLHTRASKLLHDIEEGIQTHGIVKTEDTGELVYAYEVDGLGNALYDFDDANVPSLLSIPLLGWSGFDRDIYRTTRARLLSKKNPYYFAGDALRGIGSPHTPRSMVWPMAMVIEALTEEGTDQELADSFVFQIRQTMASACNDAMHESVSSSKGCQASFTRAWFEWTNALFVVLLESALGIRCDDYGLQQARDSIAEKAVSSSSLGGGKNTATFYKNRYKNNHVHRDFYQGLEALISHHA